MFGQVIAEAPAGGTYDGGGACSHDRRQRCIASTRQTELGLRRWATPSSQRLYDPNQCKARALHWVDDNAQIMHDTPSPGLH
jgi:hypothetical protein